MSLADLRMGHGYDAHQLVSGRPLCLGGVTIEHELGLAGHSDADVLLHAICDALLGAAALGDIGLHFPPTDQRHANRDSREFVRGVNQLLKNQGWVINNIDSTVVAQRPKLRPHIDAMRAHIAADLTLDITQVSVKATTTEHMGFCGREEGIAAHACALLHRATS